ncbi:MAG: gliding motility-associated protein GldE [Muribaculaceae bacterium]
MIPAFIDGGFGVSQIVALAVACACLLVSGFISGSEIAFFSLDKSDLDDMEDTPGGEKAFRLMQKPERLLATILIANNLVNVTIVVLTNFALGPVFDGMPPILSFILQTIILTFLILLFGEILPKLYASNYPEKWVRFATPGVVLISTVLSPLSRLLVSSTSIVKRVVTEQPRAVTTDDLSTALEITDVAQGDDKQILQGILEFGDTSASEIMTPRIDMTDIADTLTFDEVMTIVNDSGYARIPVYKDTEDTIVGILYSRDLLPYVSHRSDDFDWRTLLREPYFVPESRRIDDLLEDFRRRHQHLAIVVDEYGGTQGLVTMEDVLEEIVGDINDEYDDEPETWKRLPDNTFIFEGKTLLTDFFRVTDLDPEEYAPVTADAETLAGMLLAIKGDFPKDKEPLVYGRCRFLVLDIADHRITSVRVKVMADIQKI